MFDVFVSIFISIFDVIKPLFILALIVLFIFSVLVLLNIAYFVSKGKRFNKRVVKSKYKKTSAFRRLFIEFPRRYALDLLERNPDDFGCQGLIIFTGRQGRGKTASMVNFIMDLQDKYPQCKVITNLGYKYQDKPLDHWKRLIDFKNGKKGVVAVIDETQNWFSSNQSKNFPPEMLSVVTQNRKNKRVILGTAQNFYMLAKNIRSQCTEVRECMTLFGCLTFVRRREPILDNNGEVVEYKNRGLFFFSWFTYSRWVSFTI